METGNFHYEPGSLRKRKGNRRILIHMRAVLALGLVAIAVSPAWAFRLPDPNAPLLTQHQLELRYLDRQQQPYAMNYTDEAAETLGMRDGHMDVFSSKPAAHGFMPTISGGLGGDGAMLRLQWRPGN